MLSILIPIYNFNIVGFVTELQRQCTSQNIDFEILCLDDGSQNTFKKENKKVANIKNVFYHELSKNVGRSKIRNLLAEKAQFEKLLFVDCDSETSNKNYIGNYLKIANSAEVIYGGRLYKKKCSPKEKLRWLYGIKREVVADIIRNKNPHISFMANNFLINKNIYQKIKMDESITEYGHEDTLFGKELSKRNIDIHHINNPLTHIGLESAEAFLEKTRQGVENLAQLAKNKKVGNEIRLIKMHNKNSILTTLSNLFFKLFENEIINNLKGENPKLLFFDLYKLYHYSNSMK